MLDGASTGWDDAQRRMRLALESYLADAGDYDPFVFAAGRYAVQGYKLRGKHLYLEAASDHFLPSELHLSVVQRDQLERLGWNLDDRAEGNYATELPIDGGPDAVVALFEATLKVYAVDPALLKLEFLSGKVRDQESAHIADPVEPLDAEAVLSGFRVQLSQGETIRATTRGPEETRAIATSRRVFVVKRFLLGRKLNEWDYSDLTGVSLELTGSTGFMALEGPSLKSLRPGDDRAAKKTDHALRLGPDDFPTAEQCAETIRVLISSLGQHDMEGDLGGPPEARDAAHELSNESPSEVAASSGSDVAALLRELAQLRDEGEAKKMEWLRRL